jgi:hypothetical protein
LVPFWSPEGFGPCLDSSPRFLRACSCFGPPTDGEERPARTQPPSQHLPMKSDAPRLVPPWEGEEPVRFPRT